MISLIGEYECKLDAKGRFMLPAALRKQLPDDQQVEFVINRGLDQCLVLYPQEVWDREMVRIQARSPYDRKNRAFTRMFLNGATKLSLDGNARVLLPKRLMEHASLEKDLVLIAQIDKVEIWDKQAYEQWMEDPGYDLSELAEEVMIKEKDGEE
jgi:MraZ protein